MLRQDKPHHKAEENSTSGLWHWSQVGDEELILFKIAGSFVCPPTSWCPENSGSYTTGSLSKAASETSFQLCWASSL